MRISLTILMMLTLSLAHGQYGYSIEKLNIQGFNAQFSPKGDQLLYTSRSKKGLKLYDISQKSIIEISNEPGAGYQPVMVHDEIVFNLKSKNNQLQTYNIITSKKTSLGKSNNTSPKSYAANQSKNKLSSGLLVEASDDLNSINLINSNGVKTTIAPMGNKADYINLSLSPNGKKLLFRVSGTGSFVCDLKGNIVKELGNVEFPKWINDETVLYTITKDDGYNYLSSELYIYNFIKFAQAQHIKTPSFIALYPNYNSYLNKIVFNTAQGEIILIQLED